MKTRTKALISIFALTVALVGLPWAALAQSTEQLIANLHSPIVKTRREAAKKLGERRNRAAVEPLIEALEGDDDSHVRQAAARSLGLIKDDRALSPLLAALDDGSADVRQGAVVALVNYYIERDVGFITARREGLQWFNPFLDTYEETIVEPHAEIDPRIIDALIEVVLHDRDRNVKTVAIRALGVLRATSAIDQLGEQIYSSSFLRAEIIQTFIKLGDRSAAPYIIPFLNDDNSDTRYQALKAVGVLRTEAAVEELIRVYNSNRDSKTKKLALKSLGLLGDRSAEEIFLSNLQSGDADRRRFAFEGLARLGDAQRVERVSRDRIRERHDRVKLAQAFALYKLGRPEYVEAIVQELATRRRQQAYGYLLEVESEDLYPYLKDRNVPSLKWIVQALGRIGTEEAIPKLEPLLKSSDAELVGAATLAIERIRRRQELGDAFERRGRPRRIQDS